MLVWSPTNDTAWFEKPETALSVLETITVSSDASTVSGVAVDIGTSKFPSQISLTVSSIDVSSANIVFTAPHLDGLFPILSIKYLLNKVIGECFAWDDLPVAAEDLILYRRDPINPKTFFITVTATEDIGPGTGTPPEPVTVATTESKVYEIIITGNYSGGRARLVEEINARR